MATRFYLTADTAAAVSVTTSALAGWDDYSQAVSRSMPTAKTNTAIAAGSSISLGTWLTNYLDRIYVSDPVAAQTLSGTATMACQIQSRSTDSAAATARTAVAVVSNDGQTLRDFWFDLSQRGSQNYLYNSSTYRNFSWALAASDTAYQEVSAQDGDRLVVLVGYLAEEGSVHAQSKYGDPSATSDLAVNETTTTELVPWVEFSQNITFQQTRRVFVTRYC